MSKTKRSFILWTLLGALLTIIVCLAAGGAKPFSVKADEESAIATDIKQMESWNEWDGSTCFIFYLSESDYMTATEWSTESNEAYKWVEVLSYEDRENFNVSNAVLDKNLDAYNYAENILIDGVALSEYPHQLIANRYTRVDSLGILLPSGALPSASQIVVKAGCQIPSLTHSYFDKHFVCLETQEELIFTYRNGNWAKGYSFDGYVAETEYDASERYFYLRNEGSTYKGHTEAPTFDFTDIFSVNGWGDDGYALASTADTAEGTLFVADLVHPIDANEFNSVNIRVFSNVERTFAAYNASKITEGSLGEPLDTFTIPGMKFSTITMESELYANEDGVIENFVFQFLDNGSENYADNQFFIGSFSCLDKYYHLAFPTNVQGELIGQPAVDESKLFINGERVSDINRYGKYVTAEWAVKDGYYQINVKFAKTYDGAGLIKNADLSYTGNNIQAQKGLLLPNGEALDRSYTYRIYENESFLDYELIEEYEEVGVADLKVRIEPSANDNIHFLIVFDKEITENPYYHACETEEWRDKSLIVFKGMYDEDVSKAFVAGGFKASFYDNVFINGVSVGEWHAIDDLPTCVHVHYGQTDLYTLDMSIDSYSEMYKPLYEAFKKSENITIEIKSGMKFTTSVRTERDYKFVVNGTKVSAVDAEEKEAVKVYYDGKKVENGGVVISSTKAMQSNIFVQGDGEYTVAKTAEGNATKFTLTLKDGETFTFTVQENIVNEVPEEKEEKSGCSSSIAAENGVLIFTIVALFAVFAMRRKQYE